MSPYMSTSKIKPPVSRSNLCDLSQQNPDNLTIIIIIFGLPQIVTHQTRSQKKNTVFWLP